MVQIAKRLVENIPADPVAFWLARLDADTRPANHSHFERWLRWLQKQPNWEYVTARDLLVRQLAAEDQYVVLDLLQTYVSGLVLRKSSKRKAYSTIRSFFDHNRCALPTDRRFRIRGDRPPIQPKLTVKDVQQAILAASIRDQSILTVKWQSFLDNERLMLANVYCADQIVKQIQMGVDPVVLDLPGRKSGENDSEGAFYTFIGKDATDALTKYFEEIRGWPKSGEVLWLMPNGRPITKSAFEAMWMRLLRHMGKIPKKQGPVGSRYGYGMHEFRDEATTWLHTHAKAEGFDMDCVKFYCGQVGEIDPLKYDKFYKDQDYVRTQYQTAEKYLNIISGQPREIKALGKENEELRNDLGKLAKDFAVLKGQFETEFNKKLTKAE